ncbi:MAG: succinylglutamate desuccinylase/aspartoacylase family protein [Lautropia sp.]|nr:succinylglutamate desuccinylase/aspartoacylase family protein [Lautropia sp.]
MSTACTRVAHPTIELHQFIALKPGPRLLILGGVHGNETAGPVAIRQILAEFAEGRRQLERGVLSFVPVANPVAWARAQREGDRNLNRDFRPSISPETAEDRVATRLAPILAQHDVLVDLHTFSAPGEAFVFFGPANNQDELEPFSLAEAEERLAQAIGPKRLVYGWLSAYAKGVRRRDNGSVAYGVGTTEYMRAHGGYAVTVECGQHLDPNAPAVARAAIGHALEALGMGGRCLDDEGAREASPATQAISEASPTDQDEQAPMTTPPAECDGLELIELFDVFDRHSTDDHFERSWRSFDRVRAGEVIARRANGEALTAPEDGYVVFPNPGTPPGREWFYFARPGKRRLAPPAGRGNGIQPAPDARPEGLSPRRTRA